MHQHILANYTNSQLAVELPLMLIGVSLTARLQSTVTEETEKSQENVGTLILNHFKSYCCIIEHLSEQSLTPSKSACVNL